MKEFGMYVILQLLSEDMPIVLRNVTEIHYNFPSLVESGTIRDVAKVAFESDIHSTGVTYAIPDVLELQVTMEHRIAGGF